MFSGEYFCKLDEKGRFLLPSAVRDLLCPDGQAGEKGVVFLKRTDPTSLKVYPLSAWTNLLKQTRAKLDEEQSRLFMHFVVSETATSEIDKAGRILIPGKLRKHINLADDQEIVLVGMYEHFEIWEPSDWRRYLAQAENRHEVSMSKIMDLLARLLGGGGEAPRQEAPEKKPANEPAKKPITVKVGRETARRCPR